MVIPHRQGRAVAAPRPGRRWPARIALSVITCAALGALAWYVGSLGHHPALNVLVILACGAVAFPLTWTIADHGQHATIATWYATRQEESAPPVSLDYRLLWLRRDLRDTVERADRPDTIHPLLVELVRERLRTKHGIDLDTQPAAARELLPPNLVRYLDQPATANRRQDRRRLEDIVHRIEEL